MADETDAAIAQRAAEGAAEGAAQAASEVAEDATRQAAIDAANEREAEATRLAEDLALAAVEGEKGRRIATLEQENEQWRGKVQSLETVVTEQATVLQSLSTVTGEILQKISALTPPPPPDPKADPLSQAPIVEPETVAKSADEAAPKGQATDAPRKPRKNWM
jgi:hypothetical protein